MAKNKKKSPAKSAKPAQKAAPQKAMKKAAPKAAPKKGAKKAVKAAPKKSAAKTPAKKSAAKKSTAAKSKTAKPVAARAVKATAPMKSAPKAGKASTKTLTDALANFMTPLDDRVIVQLEAKAEKTAGGLYIPDTADDVTANIQGTVLAVGRGHRGPKGRVRPMDVKIGDQIVFADHSGSKIFIQNEELVILRESDVMGIVS